MHVAVATMQIGSWHCALHAANTSFGSHLPAVKSTLASAGAPVADAHAPANSAHNASAIDRLFTRGGYYVVRTDGGDGADTKLHSSARALLSA